MGVYPGLAHWNLGLRSRKETLWQQGQLELSIPNLLSCSKKETSGGGRAVRGLRWARDGLSLWLGIEPQVVGKMMGVLVLLPSVNTGLCVYNSD
jgi:hypothetical protein